MKAILLAIRNLVGNNLKTTFMIAAFIALLTWVSCSKAAELDLRAGASFVHGTGAVLGLQLYIPINPDRLDWYAGTLLWGAVGKEQEIPNNWSWESGIRACRGSLCASLGASYLQRIDALDGSHTNFNLELQWLIGWHRVQSIAVTHLSNAGTSDVNYGRNAALVSFRLQ